MSSPESATYVPFSDEKNIEKMVRKVCVFIEELTLEVSLLAWEKNPFRKNFPGWITYVSTGSAVQRQVFLYWDTVLQQQYLEALRGEMLQDEGFLEELHAYFENAYRSARGFCDQLSSIAPEELAGLSNVDLAERFREVLRYFRELVAAYYVPYDGVGALEPLVQERLAEQMSKEAADECFSAITSRGIRTLHRLERTAFLERARQIRRDTSMHDALAQQHWHEFAVYELDEDSSKEGFSQRFANVTDEELLKIERSLEEYKLENQQVEEMIDDAIDESHRRFARWLRTLLHHRNSSVEEWRVFYAHCAPLWNEMARRFGVMADDLEWLSYHEILSGLEGQEVRDILAARKEQGFVIAQRGDQIRVTTGVRPEDLHEKDINAKEIREIRGRSAFHGLASGPVRVIFDVRETTDVPDGFILVTAMTEPDFVPLMKKAAAIITDEGGLLCHAAIIARELGKPCIIGTKIATKVLKDGDMVEVDAEKGIVRILERV